MYKAVEEWLLHNSTKCITNIFLILVMQGALVGLLLLEAKKDNKDDTMLTSLDLVICRIICTVFLHLILAKEL